MKKPLASTLTLPPPCCGFYQFVVHHPQDGKVTASSNGAFIHVALSTKSFHTTPKIEKTMPPPMTA